MRYRRAQNYGDELSEGKAEQEAVVRLQMAAELYQMADDSGRAAEEALVEYWILSGYLDDLLHAEEDGPRLSAIMLTEKIGGRTQEEDARLSEARERAIDALAKLDFVLNVYYDFSRDSMIESSTNQELLNNLSMLRERVTGLLEGQDLNAYGYTKEEKWEIVQPVIERWKEFIEACYINSSIEYENGSPTLYTDNGMLDLDYQMRSSSQSLLPKRIKPRYTNYGQYGKTPTYVYYSNDMESTHKAYYVNMHGAEIWFYETDRGEVLTESTGAQENIEKYLANTDKVWELASKQQGNWKTTAASYLD